MKSRITPFGIVSLILISLVTVPTFAVSLCQLSEKSDVPLGNLTAVLRNSNCNVRSLDDLLSVFPADALSRFALFYESESVQGPHFGDFLHPRAVIATADGNEQLVVSFNGDPRDLAFNALEILEINRHHGQLSTDVFRYFEIHFPKENLIKDLTWREVQDQITVSGPNPRTCVVCHGNPARALYQGYPVWTGSYGSFHIEGVPGERTHFENFLKDSDADPKSRYRHLIYKNIYTQGGIYEGLLKGYANADLNFTLAQANGLRVGALMQNTPDYERFKYAIAGAVLYCEEFDKFLPPSLYNALAQNLDTVFSLNRTYTDDFVRSSLRPFYADGGGHFGDFHLGDAAGAEKMLLNAQNNPGARTYFNLLVDTLLKQGVERTQYNAVNLRFVTESRGIDISKWFLDLMQPTYRTMESGGADSMIYPLLATDPDLRAISGLTLNEKTGLINAFPHGDEQKQLCTQLKQQSLAHLQNFSVPALPAPMPFVPRKYPALFLKTCAECHIAYMGVIAPAIPFTSQVAFENWLRAVPARKAEMIGRLTDPVEIRRMPPTRLLSAEELQSVISYLNSVTTP